MAKCENCYYAEVCKNYPNTGIPEKSRQRLLDKGCENFKDKSLIVELPCRVGDVLFTIEYNYDVNKSYIVKIECISIEIHDCGISIYCKPIEKNYDTYVPVALMSSSIGKTVFFSREEAERALEESEKNG